MELRPGEVLEGSLDTYLITATINRGAYGCVFRARTSDGAWRVVKQFAPSENLAEAEEAYQRRCFEREADILTRFRHPLMVRGDELIRRDEEMFLVMEHVQGRTLRDLLEERRLARAQPFDADTVRGIGRQLCQVLDDLHRLPDQLIYRDLKPANVLWDAVARRIKLVDFGTARFNAEGRQATQGLGTEGYAPPELYGRRMELAPATDVYTIGAVLYELATGATPPTRETPRDFRGHEASLPEPLRAAILRALQQDPGERFATAAELSAALLAEAQLGDRPPLRLRPRNLHPLLACYCPQCGREPTSDDAVFCGVDGLPYHVALLQLVPRHRPLTTVYLDRPEMTIGRADPEGDCYPEIDVSAADAGRHVSRRHATLRRSGTQYELLVHPTTNPTRLDGRLLAPSGTYAVAPGARLELGDLVARLLLRPAVDLPEEVPA